MTWIVIIDNGESYSDHTHWTACTCKDKETADKAVAAYHKWRDAAAAFEESSPGWEAERAWSKANPCPFPSGSGDEYISSNTYRSSASAVEVPEWAETKP